MQGELITFRKMFGQSIAELSIIFKINMKGNLSIIIPTKQIEAEKSMYSLVHVEINYLLYSI